MNKKTAFALFIVLILSLGSIRALFQPGFFTMHDDQQIVRLAEMDQALKAGQFPVRWVQNLGFGYGYPLFMFYPPLVYYLGETFYLGLGVSYITAMKLVFATSFLASAATMYLWTKDKWGTMPATIAAIFYTYAPYRAVDAYVRGALAESFSFVWLPLILLAMDKLLEPKLKHPRVWVLVLGISYAALMITHNLIVLPFSLLMVGYFILKQFYLSTSQKISSLRFLILAGVIGLGLSCFFWLPALTQKQYTLVDQILLEEKYSHELHYAYPAQLWNSIWGYGGSTEGTLDGFSLKVGKAHVVASILTVLFGLLNFSLLKRKNNQLLTASVLLGISLWMTTAYSSLIWDNFSPLQFLQFPWRFLTFIVLFSSYLTGALVYVIREKTNVLFSSLLAVGLLIAVWLPNYKLFVPQTFLDVDDDFYTSDEFTKWQISKTSFEFVPKGVETTTDPDLGVTQLAITRDMVAITPVYLGEASAGQLKIDQNVPHLKQVHVNLTTSTQIHFNVFNYPGWELFANGNQIEIEDNNPLKLISTTLPAGEHALTLVFKPTAEVGLANLVSLLSLLVVAGVGWYPRMKKLYEKN